MTHIQGILYGTPAQNNQELINLQSNINTKTNGGMIREFRFIEILCKDKDKDKVIDLLPPPQTYFSRMLVNLMDNRLIRWLFNKMTSTMFPKNLFTVHDDYQRFKDLPIDRKHEPKRPQFDILLVKSDMNRKGIENL